MANTGQSMPAISDPEDEKYEEEWDLLLNNKAQYTLNKLQARVLLQEMAMGNRGIIPFKTFVVPIPYIVEFRRFKRFLKGTRRLPAQASELPYKPISPERWKEFKKEIYKKVGKIKDKR